MDKIKKVSRKLLIFFSVFILLLGIPVSSHAESSLSITRWIVEAELLTNGDLSIAEDITFDFSGDFNGVFREVVLKDTSGMENLSVREMVKGKEIKYANVSDAAKGDSGVFTTSENNNSNTIKIFSPSHDQQKTFRISYVIKDVAVKYSDTGELYYKFLGKENETPIDFFSVNLKLPGSKKDRVKIYAHGPSNGRINFKSDNIVHLEVENVPKNTFVEARVLFPTKFIPDSHNISGKDGYDRIIGEEQRFAQKLEQKSIRREKAKTSFNYISIALGGLQLIFIALFASKNRRELDIYRKSDYNIIPEDCTPAVASYLVYLNVSSSSIIATIFDLCRKGYLSIEEIKDDIYEVSDKKFSSKKAFSDKDDISNFKLTKIKEVDNELLEHEKYFIGWLIDSIGDGKQVTTDDIEYYGKKHNSQFLKSYTAWQKKVKEEAINKGYFEKKKGKYGVLLIILFVIILPVSIISISLGGLYGLFSLIISIIGFIYGITLFFRKSDYGYIQYRKWIEFKKYMKRFATDLSPEDMDKYPVDISLIYALALGVDRKILNEFKTIDSTQYEYNNGFFYWYFLMSDSKNNAFDKSINKAFTPVAPSSGSGGGFSGGGGGGTGGGGAGGF